MAVAGVNVDPRFPNGRPPASLLADNGIGWARFSYRVSLGAGTTDLGEAHGVYGPYLDALARARVQPIVTLTHEAWGEAQGFDWDRMALADWARLIDGYVEMARRIAQLYGGRGLTYQIWNEPDQASDAAVGMPPITYGALFSRARTAIRGVDSTAKVITAGFVSGPVAGPAYFKASGIGPATDGVAFHPYLARAAGYGTSPSFGDQIAAWERATNQPLYITEWGMPGQYAASDGQLAAYARECLSEAAAARAAVWFAWADGMHTSIGVVRHDGTIREDLLAALRADGGAETRPGLARGRYRLDYPGKRINVRQHANLGAPVLTRVSHGEPVFVLQDDGAYDGTYVWQTVETAGGVVGEMATVGGAWKLVPATAGQDARALLEAAQGLINEALTKL